VNDRRGGVDAIASNPSRKTFEHLTDLGLGDDVEVLAELGRGAKTVVYRIRRGGTDFAVKMLQSSPLVTAGDVAAFRREAALLARVSHPGVPRVFDVGVSAGRPYLVQEYVDGRPLALRLESGPGAVSEPALLRLATDVAEALEAAHRAGLVHRDIKPANILMTQEGRARLIDFGLAATGEQPASEAVIGSFLYSAPEQTGMLSRPVDGRADLYALGAVLFQCATGHPPYQARDAGELLTRHASSPVPDPRTSRPELSAGTAELITRLLAKDPDDRFQSARELRIALGHVDPGGANPWTGSGHVESRPPMAGRGHERALLTRRWERARAGQGGVALVVGPSGAGKSHLARTVVDVARADGSLILAGKCEQGSPLPLAPLRAAVEGYLRTVATLPPPERDAAVQRLRDAAGAGAALLHPLSPTLAVLLNAPRLATGEHHEQFVNAVAMFIAELTASAGGLLLLDDVQWLDALSRSVLRRVVEAIGDAPVLILATGRDDPDSAEGLAAVEAAAGHLLDVRVTLAPLDDDGTRELVVWYLAGATVGNDVAAQVLARGQGNAFTILEYLRALIDAGALRPSWGTWRLDVDVFRAIDLPDGVLDLILARIDGLGARSRAVLTDAAAIGATIDVDLLAEVSGAGVAEALADAAEHGLLQRDSDGYVFVHDRIREALLSAVAPHQLSPLHQRTAEALDRQCRNDPAGVYATARHYAQGETHLHPERVLVTGWAAGQLALDESAPDAAVSFLEPAVAVARSAGLPLDSRVKEALGVAYWLTGRIAQAREQLESGLDGERDPLRRAALRLQLANVLRTSWQLSNAIQCARLGLADLGRPVPTNSLLFGLQTAGTMLRWLVRGSRPPADRPAEGEEGERLRLFALLCRAASATAAINLQGGLLIAFNLRPLPVAHRLGPTAAYVHYLAGIGSIAGALRLRKRRDRIFERAFRISRELGDPKAYANAVWFDAFAKVLGKELGIGQWNDASDAQRDWLELDFYTNIVLMRARDLLQRGYATQALEWHDRGRSRISEATVDVFPGFAVLAQMVDALLGRTSDAPTAFAARAAEPLDPGHAIQFVLGAVQTALEQDELGDSFEAALQAFDRLGVPMSEIFPEYRMIFAYETFARLTQCQRAAEADRATSLATADLAWRRLGTAAKGSGASADPASVTLLRGYHLVAGAGLLQVRGEHDRCLDVLAEGAAWLLRLDAPLVEYEAARVRARALAGLGRDALSERAAQQALTLARQYGWTRRAHWVRTEFPGATEAMGPRASVNGYLASTGSRGADRYQRRLAALLQVSTAAARILDPQQLARVALDETLHILGAERAMLFLADDDGLLQPALGRDASASDLIELSAYSSTLVDRVAGERVSLVVTGSEEGAALGSESAVVHGLRSIMIAPLEFDDRLIGVVYLDSRVARGVFTEADIEILTALTSHIAVSLETARAAQLEIAVQSAQEQRDIAELLRLSIQELTATLDPRDVLDRLLAVVARTIPADRVTLVHQDGDERILATSDGGVPGDLEVDALLALGQARCGQGRTGMPPAVATALGEAGGWLTAPLVTRGHGRGVLLATSATPTFTATHVDIVSALASEGAIAYDNARLFAQVQRLATTDSLTGIHNRRHFTELAGQQVVDAIRNDRPLVALMIDIDNFKRVNDDHGHATGDEVIRMVALAMQSQIRAADVLGRYGGEEFAVVLSEVPADPRDIAEKLRRAVADTHVPHPAGPIRVTVSVGFTRLTSGDDLERLLARADEALYRAKDAGRDRIACC